MLVPILVRICHLDGPELLLVLCGWKHLWQTDATAHDPLLVVDVKEMLPPTEVTTRPTNKSLLVLTLNRTRAHSQRSTVERNI